MTKIRILPEILSNKIAAGEVVERPASVVKELLENAIDAGSTKITIEIGQGGRSLIRVADDGSGMGHDDALLALERYATSKIADDPDLFSIRTLGFRGEALPSIASVSRLTIETREAGHDAGTRIEVEGGKIKSVAETGAPVGTMIAVRQLFFNTPARRKFLKTVSTEMGHIAELAACTALAWPDIRFVLIHNSKEVKSWPRAADPIDRTADVLGPEIRSSLHPVAFATGNIRLSGWIADPSVTRSTSQKIYTFVNGRHIRDRGMQYALFEGFRGRIMKGRFPVAALFLKLPPEEVDVNVHPAKHEIRFADSRQIYEAIRAAVAGAFASAREKPFRTASVPPPGRVQESIPLFAHPSPPAFQTQPRTPDEPHAPKPQPPHEDPLPLIKPVKPQSAFTQTPLWEKKRFSEFRVIGQFQNTYILCEHEGELILVDQHAAHERIVYERLKSGHSHAGQTAVQKLILPETFELGFKEASAIGEIIEELNQLGLEIEPFGGNTFVVKAAPVLLGQQEIRPLIVEMAETINAVGHSPGLADVIDACLVLMACHGAIRAHQPLAPTEMKVLLSDLDRCENPFHCPHGRPTLVEWPVGEIEKRFRRKV